MLEKLRDVVSDDTLRGLVFDFLHETNRYGTKFQKSRNNVVRDIFAQMTSLADESHEGDTAMIHGIVSLSLAVLAQHPMKNPPTIITPEERVQYSQDFTKRANAVKLVLSEVFEKLRHEDPAVTTNATETAPGDTALRQEIELPEEDLQQVAAKLSVMDIESKTEEVILLLMEENLLLMEENLRLTKENAQLHELFCVVNNTIAEVTTSTCP